MATVDPFARLAAAPKTDPRPNPKPAPPPVTDHNRGDFFAAAKRAAGRGKGADFLRHNAQVIDRLSAGDRVKLNSIVSPSLGQTERQDIASSYSKSQPLGLAEKIVGVPLKAAYQITEGLASSPAGAVQAAKAVGPAVFHAAKGGVTPAGQAREQAKPSAQHARHALHQLAKAQAQSVASDFRHPLDRLGYLTLDAFAAVNAAAKLGTLAKVLPHVPHERSLKVEGGTVQPQASPATLTRMAQHRLDRLSEAHPDNPAGGAKVRAARRIPFERQREHDRAMQPAAPFAAARQKLSRSEDFAYDVHRRYGKNAPDRIDKEIQYRKQRIADATSLTEKAHQRKRLVQLQLAHAHVTSPSPKLRQALDLGRELTGKAEKTKIEVGQLTPETASAHLHEAATAAIPGLNAPLAEVRTLDRLQEPGVERARGQAARLQGRYAAAEAQVAKQKFTRGEQKKIAEQGITERVTVEKPRTRAATAKPALDKIIARHPRVEIHANEDAHGIRLSMMRVAEGERGGGLAKKALRDVLAYADRRQVPIALTPEPVGAGGLSKTALANWYARHGFVRNTGKAKDFRFTESMVRQPKPLSPTVKKRVDLPVTAQRVGDVTVAPRGAVLRPQGTFRQQRVGGALSIAKDRLQTAEKAAATRRGMTPEQYRQALATRDERLQQIHQAHVAGGQQLAAEGAFYAPDTARQPIASLGQRARSGITGKPRPLVQRSRHILFQQGRARTTSKTTLEDFQKTTRYAGHIQDIAEAKKFSRPLNPKIPGGLDEGHEFFNPEGHKIPRSFKEAPAASDLEGLTPKEISDAVRADHEALMSNTFPDETTVRNLSPKMRAKVRQIDAGIKRAFEGPGYKPRKFGFAKTLGEIFDTANDTTKLALVYLSGHYVPANYLGNLAFGAIHQGVWLPVNLAKASARLGVIEPDVLKMIDAETGQGASLGLATSRGAPTSRILHGVAGFMGKLADNGPRRAAWIHEAARRGYKTSAQMRHLLTDPKLRRVLNQASGNAEDAMVKFRGMSELERATIARATFLYPWIRGATRYGLRLPLDRPGRAALLAHLGEQGRQDIEKRLGQLVSYLDQLIPVGSPQKKLGTTVQKVVSPASVTPFGTARDVAQTVGRTITGKGPGKQLAQYLQPVIKGGFEAGTGYNTFTGRNYPAGTKPIDILRQNLYGGAGAVQLYKGLHAQPQTEPFFGAPGKQPNYLQGGLHEAVGRFLIGGLYPRELNVPAARAKGLAERQAGLPAPERSYQTELSKARQQARHFKVPGGLPAEVAQDLRWRRDLDLALSQLRGGGLRPEEKASAAAALFAKRYPQAKPQIARALQSARTDDDYLHLYKSLRAEATQGISKWNAEFNAAEKQERAAVAG